MHTQGASVLDLAPLRPTLRPSFSRRSTRSSGRKTGTPTTKSEDVVHDISSQAVLHFIAAALDPLSDLRGNEDALIHNIDTASGTEKTFALKVARSSTLLKIWCKELENWPWMGGFEAPEPNIEKQAEENKVNTELHDILNAEYWGSLPKHQVLAYEDRIDVIYDQLEDLDMEEQKSRVLQKILGSNTSGSISASVNLLDDLANITTTLVLQALPFYIRLASMLETWSLRIAVLQQIPEFRKELEETQRAREDAWLAIGVRVDNTVGFHHSQMTKMRSSGLFRESFDRLRNVYEDKIASLGQRVDTMLDLLEGREESLPDSWIDAVEELEIDYSSWTVEAGRKVLQYEHRQDMTHPWDKRNIRESPVERSRHASAATIGEPQVLHMPGAWEDEDDQIGRKSSIAKDFNDGNQIYEAPHDVIRSIIYASASPKSVSYRSATPSGFFPRVVSNDYGHRSGSYVQSRANLDADHTETPWFRKSPSQSYEAEENTEVMGQSFEPQDPFSRPGLRQLRTLSSLAQPIPTPLRRDFPLPSAVDAPANDVNCGVLTSAHNSVKGITDRLASVEVADDPFLTFNDKSTSDSVSSPLYGPQIPAGPEYSIVVPEAPPRLRVALIKRRSTSTSLLLSTISRWSSEDSTYEKKTSVSEAPRTPSPRTRPTGATDAQLEQVIGRVLTLLPTRIRFKRESLDYRWISRVTDHTIPSSGNKEPQNDDEDPELVLIPAYQKESRLSKLNHNSAIKLFYLIDGDKSPVKLFIRFVGESGRVVVRVGGGWADLAEYLREYVQHHGRAMSPERPPTRNSSPLTSVFKTNINTTRIKDQSPERRSKLHHNPTTTTEASSAGLSPVRPDRSVKASPSIPPIRSMNTFQPRRSQIPTPNGSPRTAHSQPLPPSTPTRLRTSVQRAAVEGQVSGGIGLGLMGPAVAGRTKMSPEKEKWVSDMVAQVYARSPAVFEE